MKQYLTGANGVAEAIKHGRGRLYIARKSKRIEDLVDMAKRYGVPWKKISEPELKSIVKNMEHRGFALEVEGRPRGQKLHTLDDLFSMSNAVQTSLVLVLDGISDPGNLGAILRAADQFAADAVIVPRRRSVGREANSLSRTSSGAVEWVPLLEAANTDRCLRDLKQNGYWVWGADMSGKPAHGVNLKGRSAIVMGREGEGLHRLVRENCDGLIRIPTGGRLDSLNVAAAAAILMYEMRRQGGFEYGNS